MPVCSFDFEKAGPFNQTIFLGCSISDFNINLGWGADASTCTVKLVEDSVSHPQDGSYDAIDTALSTLLSSTQASQVFNNNTLNMVDNSKSLFKNIAQKLVDNENYRDLEDVSKLDADIKDNGKIMWDTSLLGSASARKTRLLADPGFIGWKHTIIGCPAYFKFHDIEFGGYIKKWNYTNNGLYDVELNSFGSLLKGCQLILQQYRGSISTLLDTTGGSVAVPYGDVNLSAFNGTIADGNIPNVFNIYGYLESKGFGTSLVSERGISAALVYDTLIELLAPNLNPRLQNMYSPYGAIVAKSPMKKGESGVESSIYTRSETFKDVPLTQLGLLKTMTAVDGIYRSLLGLDISEVPKPPDGIMLTQTQMSIADFIDGCCEKSGCNYIVDFIPANASSGFSGFIKIRIISRRVQPPPNILRNFFNTLTKNDAVLSASVGEEFSDENVRTMIVGGPQERLYQVSSNTVSRYRSYYRFEPEIRSKIDYSANVDNSLLTGNARNVNRIPLAHRQRWYDYAFIDGAVVAQQTTQAQYFTPIIMGHSTMSVFDGAYETATPNLGSFSTASYPIHADLISPYFGRDSFGNVRKVFFDKATSQLQIIINTADIASFFPTYGVSGSFAVFENEIRAAMSGFDNWLTYVFEMSKLGFGLSTAQLIYAYLRSTYGTQIADNIFIDGVGVLKNGGKPQAMPVIPPVGNTIAPKSALTYTTAVLNILQKLHRFFQDLGTKHYGRDFLVRMPTVSTYLDEAGVRQYDYQITDSGWEEEGNFIDDTIAIGSTVANSMADESGKFGVIIGYNNIAEYKGTVADNIGNKLNSYQLWEQHLRYMQSVNPGDNWYYPLVPDIDPNEVYWMPYTTYNIPGQLPAGPLVGRTANLSIPGAFPSTYNTAHGQTPADNFKYKIYVKGSTVDAAPENRYNRKMLYTPDATYCVISSPGPVWIRSPRSLNSIMMEDLVMYDAYGSDNPGGASYFPGAAGAFTRLAVPHNYMMFAWANSEKAIVDGIINPQQPSVNNMEIHPRAAIPCFAAIPVKLNNFVYGPWSSNPNLIRDIIFPNSQGDSSTVYTNNIVGGVKVEIETELTPWNYGGIENLDYAVLNRIAAENNYQQILENGSVTVAGIQYGKAGVGYRLLNANMGPVINSIVTQVAEDGIKTTFGLRTYSRKLGFYNKESADNIARIGRESLKRRKEIADNIRNLSVRSSASTTTSSDFSNSRPKAMNWSPVSVIVGNAYPFVHKNSSLTNTANQMGFGPSWHLRPQIPTTINSSPQNMVRQQTQVSIYDPGELPAVFRDVSYNDTSIMSIDGILSPISFYPTPYGSTYAITAYLRSKCPYCNGQGTVTYNYLDTSTLLTTSATAASFNTLKTARTQKTEPCRFCLPDEQKKDSYKKNVKPSETIPPYIVASGDDLTIINNSQNTFASNNPAINRYTLNPMVMSVGEFSCSTNKQNTDSCGHSIDVVAFGDGDGAAGGLRAALSNSISNNYADTNNRFFGLRGPLMVHGWGYDIEGYPVPNASGEFKIVNGTIVRDNNNNPVYKNQILQADGTYSAPYKENSFYKSWAQLPSTWPVGPVDLRWDDDAGVWTVGNNYKPVWVVLENDLVNSDPVRGTILEGYLDNDPLPNNLRKLVFVKDGSKLFSAPRGAAIYCKYNSNNGFYEPIYNQPYVTSGTIIGGSLATIYKAYNGSTLTPPGATPESYQSNFTNPLNLNVSVNSLGLFIYLNGSWVLQAART